MIFVLFKKKNAFGEKKQFSITIQMTSIHCGKRLRQVPL